ncbi:MAG: polysaccharide deacetylase family protein [Methanotrichaceae archaeon]|nr:polysaccharide deacetylase family protein [Methanotrichaceae archaeon]
MDSRDGGSSFINSVSNYLYNNIDILDFYSTFRSNFKSVLLILIYHGVGQNQENWMHPSINEKIFETQINYIKRRYKVISLKSLVSLNQEKKPLPKKAAIITFDDGYKNIYKYAYPILRKYNIPATIFLTTGVIGTGDLLWWDKISYIIWKTDCRSIEFDSGMISLESVKERSEFCFTLTEKLKGYPNNKKFDLIEDIGRSLDVKVPSDIGKKIYLSWSEIIEMNSDGFEMGSHTISHPILTKIALKDADYEIANSKRDIEHKIKANVVSFSYPNGLPGDYNAEIINLLKENGFKCAVTSTLQEPQFEGGLFELARKSATFNLVPFRFAASHMYDDIYKIRKYLWKIDS